MKDDDIKRVQEFLSEIPNLQYLKEIVNREGTYRHFSVDTLRSSANDIVDKSIKSLKELEEYLVNEIKYNELARQKRISGQKTFEKYITNVPKPGYDKYNFYGELNGLFTLANGNSLYQLNEPFLISNFILDKQRKGARWVHRSKLASEEELKKYLYSCKKLMGNNRLLVEFQSKNADNSIINYDSGIISH